MSMNQSTQPNAEDAAKANQIKLSIPPAVAEGKYANLLINNYSKDEFMLDFGLITAQIKQAIVHSRVILTPRNAKKLLTILTDQVAAYEKKHGVIEDDQKPSGPVKFSFN